MGKILIRFALVAGIICQMSVFLSYNSEKEKPRYTEKAKTESHMAMAENAPPPVRTVPSRGIEASKEATSPYQPPVTRKIESIKAPPKGAQYTMNFDHIEQFSNMPQISDNPVLKEMAQKEAERIMQTGDYESLLQKFKEHSGTLHSMGYDF